jgi:hypothetical protein
MKGGASTDPVEKKAKKITGFSGGAIGPVVGIVVRLTHP